MTVHLMGKMANDVLGKKLFMESCIVGNVGNNLRCFREASPESYYEKQSQMNYLNGRITQFYHTVSIWLGVLDCLYSPG